MIFLVVSALSLIGLTARGILTMETIRISAYLIPSVIIDSICGVKLGGDLPQRRFRALVMLLLTALALKFI